MNIVTLTTDFGTQDYFVGALKGALLSCNPNLYLVDISHTIEPYNIVQAAYVVQNVFHEFPEGTIHLIGVNCVYAENSRFVAARREGHFFLAPDNGLLALLFGEIPMQDVVALETVGRGHFPVKEVFANAVGKLSSISNGKPQKAGWGGISFSEIGPPAGELLKRISLQPVITPARIRGTILHIDNFDNAIVNIRKEVFEKVRNGRAFSLFFKRHDPITLLSENYCDVPIGEPLCLFNSAGFLEIAINMGKASGLLGLKPEDVVEVVFSPNN